MHVKLVKIDGEFVWHRHEEEDELFLVVDGAIEMHYRGPDGAEHKPVAPHSSRSGSSRKRRT